MPLLPTASNALPGTIDATLAGCNCRCAAVPRKLQAFIDNPASQNLIQGNASRGQDVLQEFYKNRGVIFSGEDHSYAIRTLPDGPAVPRENGDENAYYGDFVISSLTHELATRTIYFTLKTTTWNGVATTTMLGDGSGIESIFVANSEPGRALGVAGGGGGTGTFLAYRNHQLQAAAYRTLEIQTGDVVHIRGVTPVAYSGRYVVQRIGQRRYAAFHASTTQLAAAAPLSPLGFVALKSYPLQPTSAAAGSEAGDPQFAGFPTYREIAAASGSNMLCSYIDDTYARTPVKSIYSDRIHTVSNRYISKVLDDSFKSESDQRVAVQNSRIITPVPVDFAQIVENRISPTCPLHAPGSLQ